MNDSGFSNFMETQFHYLDDMEKLHQQFNLSPNTVFIFDQGLYDSNSLCRSWYKIINKSCSCFICPNGEQSKSFSVFTDLISNLLALPISAQDMTLVAVGGGALCDLVGFIASVLYRGVNTIYFPTTLLAAVDASIGGKTAINYEGIKNNIGTYHEPSSIFTVLPFIQSCPKSILLDGFAEIIKHGLIKDENLFQATAGLCIEGDFYDTIKLLDIIKINQKIKLNVVKESKVNPNIRNILNYGHTVGHALESIFKGEISHGQAVFIGMYYETILSNKLGFLSDEYTKIALNYLYHWITLSDRFLAISANDLYKVMCKDKKSKNNIPRAVCINHIGSVENSFDYCHNISQELLEEVHKDVIHAFCHTKSY